jgi:hypothetical protein
VLICGKVTRCGRCKGAEAVDQQKRAALVLERDGLKRRLVVIEAAMDAGTAARAWNGKIAELQLELERVEVALATLEGQLAAARLTADECEVYVTRAIADLERLPELGYEDQQKHLRAWVRQVRLSPEVIETDLYCLPSSDRSHRSFGLAPRGGFEPPTR